MRLPDKLHYYSVEDFVGLWCREKASLYLPKNFLNPLTKMFRAYLLVVVVVLNNQIASLPVASAVVKRSVLEESIITLLKEEEKSNQDFQRTILNTIQAEFKDIRDVISLNVSKIVQDGRYQNEKSLSSLELILSKLYCPSKFRYSEHSCLKLSNASVDWESAKRKCQEENTRITSMDSRRFKSLIGEKSLKNDVTIWTGKDSGSLLDSSLLNTDQVNKLRNWFSGKKFKLLYRASRDGMSSVQFHNKCDDKGPTISIGKDSSDGAIYGGYASVSWGTPRNGDSNAFLFQLCNERTQCATARYNVKEFSNSVIDDENYGPTFGQDHELKFFSGSASYNSIHNYFQSDGKCSYHSNSYEGTLSCPPNMLWTDVEVWSVVDESMDCFAFISSNQTVENRSCFDKARYVCEL